MIIFPDKKNYDFHSHKFTATLKDRAVMFFAGDVNKKLGDEVS